ncbi:MAG: DUF899 domain-containing protein [Saprospiraceae bacterium]|nr:DUF899 domain-containing protein [Saprospiraceae bacterium]
MKTPKIVSREEWLEARKALLNKEKEFSHIRDALSQQIRNLPWVQVEKEYSFGAPSGEKSFLDLFDGRKQLVVYHFMMGPNWEAGCKSCSFWADNFNGIISHLNQREVSMVAVSRAPIEKIEAFRKRMGWSFDWYSSLGSDFNYDFHVSARADEISHYNYKESISTQDRELPGISVFALDKNNIIYHTYSRYARGLDLFNTAYHYLDIVPRGRDESELLYPQAWVKHKDLY